MPKNSQTKHTDSRSRAREWIEVSKIAIRDHDAKIPCPECGEDAVEIEEVTDSEGVVHSLVLRCPKCESGASLRL